MHNLLIPGRWNAIPRDVEASLLRLIGDAKADLLIFVVTAAGQAYTRRNPLLARERVEIIQSIAAATGRPYAIYPLADQPDSGTWVRSIEERVFAESQAQTRLSPVNTRVLTGNPDVRERFAAAGYPILRLPATQTLATDVLASVVAGQDWRQLASAGTVRVYEAHDIPARLKDLFRDVLLTDDGELATGRDFAIYAAGMDASLRVKLADIVPLLRPGRIVDKGCGTGQLLVHLSELCPGSEIIGVDLSQELLHMAESQHYPRQNVNIVRGNIIEQRFAAGSVDSVLFSSVLHEVYSYHGYDREQIRLALRHTHAELKPGGRVIIRDGVRPAEQAVWMWCDPETTARFRRFAVDFKGKSSAPGVRFLEAVVDGTTWFHLSLPDANEFLSKKDYLANWTIEVNEEFGVFTLAEWRRELEGLGFDVIEARSYVNEWIRVNRYEGKVALCVDVGGRPGPPLPFPDTTAVIAAGKR